MISEIIIITAIFAVIIMFSPLTFSVNSARRDKKIDGFFHVKWIIFILSYSFRERRSEVRVLGRLFAGYSNKPKLPENKDRSDSKDRSDKKKTSKKRPAFEDIFNLVGPVFKLLKELIKCFNIKDLHIDARFGANDPAHTGIITGIFYAMTSCFNTGNKVRMTADFEKPCLEWDMLALGAVTPVRVLIAVIRFITDRRVIRSGFHMIANL